MEGENSPATEISEAVETALDTALENAEQRAETAEIISEAIADSARKDAVVKEVNEFEREINSWRSETNSKLEALTESNRNLSAQLSEATQALAVMSGAMASLIPQASPELEPSSEAGDGQERTEVQAVEPETAEIQEVEIPAPARPRRRLI